MKRTILLCGVAVVISACGHSQAATPPTPTPAPDGGNFLPAYVAQ